MAGVIWHSVSLTGFGPYAEKTTYTFPAGLGVLVAPNESGKSTLVAGLMATLYGLPAGGSPRRLRADPLPPPGPGPRL